MKDRFEILYKDISGKIKPMYTKTKKQKEELITCLKSRGMEIIKTTELQKK